MASSSSSRRSRTTLVRRDILSDKPVTAMWQRSSGMTLSPVGNQSGALIPARNCQDPQPASLQDSEETLRISGCQSIACQCDVVRSRWRASAYRHARAAKLASHAAGRSAGAFARSASEKRHQADALPFRPCAPWCDQRKLLGDRVGDGMSDADPRNGSTIVARPSGAQDDLENGVHVDSVAALF